MYYHHYSLQQLCSSGEGIAELSDSLVHCGTWQSDSDVDEYQSVAICKCCVHVRAAGCFRLHRFAIQEMCAGPKQEGSSVPPNPLNCRNPITMTSIQIVCLLSTVSIQLHNSAVITVSTQAAAMRGDVTARTLL